MPIGYYGVLQRVVRGLQSLLAFARPFKSVWPGVTAKPHEALDDIHAKMRRRTYRQLTALVRSWAWADKAGYRA
jgi:hypothetical protein